MEPITQKCPHCQATLIEKEGKNGKFYVCPNWKKDGSGCEGIIEFPPKEKGKTGGTERKIKENDQGEIIIKKLNQILYLLTGISIEDNPEEFKEIMEKRFGKNIFDK